MTSKYIIPFVIPASLSLLIGASLVSALSVLPEYSKVIILNFILLAIVAILLTRRVAARLSGEVHRAKTDRRVNFIIFIILGILFGFDLGFIHAKKFSDNLIYNNLPQEYLNTKINIKATITSVPENNGKNIKFIASSSGLCLIDKNYNNINNCENKKLNINFSLNLLDYKNNKINQDYINIKPGDYIDIIAKLKLPRNYSNPGGRDIEKFCFSNNIYASGNVIKINNITPEKHPYFNINHYRYIINNKINSSINNIPRFGLMQALSLGLRANISKESWLVFQKTGTSHLMAISGLHVGLVSTMFFLLSKKIWSRFYCATNLMPSRIFGSIIASIMAVIYGAMAGFSVPTVRACIMVVVVTTLISIGKKIPGIQILALACFIIIIVDPLSVLSIGFWLSFGAVFSLIYGVSGRINLNKITNTLRAQVSVFTLMLPMGLLFFNKVSIISPIANIIAIPYVSFLVVPLCLFGSVLLLICEPLGNLLLNISMWFMNLIWILLEFLANLNFSEYAFTSNHSIFSIILAVLGILILLAPKGVPGKNFGFICLLPVLLNYNSNINNSSFKFTVLDVGQGLAVVVQTKNHVLLYDTGPKFGEYNDAGLESILPYLKINGIKKLDAIVLSHLDIDHRGGLQSVINNINYKNLYTSDITRLQKLNNINQALPIKCDSNTKWEWDGVNFEIISENIDFAKHNNNSCVLKISTGENSVLITGDIEQPREGSLLRNLAHKLPSNILVVPHHGSMSSSSSDFIRAVNPQFALIACGYNNMYGFPKRVILDRYKDNNSDIYSTVNSGAISFIVKSDSSIEAPSQWRSLSKKYWNRV